MSNDIRIKTDNNYYRNLNEIFENIAKFKSLNYQHMLEKFYPNYTNAILSRYFGNKPIVYLDKMTVNQSISYNDDKLSSIIISGTRRIIIGDHSDPETLCKNYAGQISHTIDNHNAHNVTYKYSASTRKSNGHEITSVECDFFAQKK